jgi:hypothetical protein
VVAQMLHIGEPGDPPVSQRHAAASVQIRMAPVTQPVRESPGTLYVDPVRDSFSEFCGQQPPLFAAPQLLMIFVSMAGNQVGPIVSLVVFESHLVLLGPQTSGAAGRLHVPRIKPLIRWPFCCFTVLLHSRLNCTYSSKLPRQLAFAVSVQPS